MAPTTAVLFAVPWCAKCQHLRDFLAAGGVSYRELNPEVDPAVAHELAQLTGGSLDVPTIQIGATVLASPDDEALSRTLGVPIPADLDLYDVAIVGGGPAGLTAAIYTTRERLRTLVLEKAHPGGQAAATGQIENYPGFPDPVGGAELMDRVHRQALRFGADIRPAEEVTAIGTHGALFRITTATGAAYRASSVILAMGSVYRRTGVPGEERLIGRGVSFCATCDAPFFRGQAVVVVGGGNSALQETVHLAAFASHITLIQILDHLTASRVLVERIHAIPTVDVLLAHRLLEVEGSDGVEAVRVADLATGTERRIPCAGVFVFIGLDPNSACLLGFADLDPQGFVLADAKTLETSVPGVFAAGDVRAGSAKQITAAAGEGTVAAFMVAKWLQSRRRA